REPVALLGLRHLFATPAARVAQAARDRRTAAALAAAGLAHRGDVDADRLDSAEQRRLQIARVVATGAPALLLDEPAAGMSRDGRDELVGILRGLAAAGHGVLLVEHDMT